MKEEIGTNDLYSGSPNEFHPDGDKSSENSHSTIVGSGSVMTAYQGLSLGRNSSFYAKESRIHLPSLEDEHGRPLSTFPAPHLSIPVLPPIKKSSEDGKNNNSGYATLKRPRPTASLKNTVGVSNSQIPSSVDLQAIR